MNGTRCCRRLAAVVTAIVAVAVMSSGDARGAPDGREPFPALDIRVDHVQAPATVCLMDVLTFDVTAVNSVRAGIMVDVRLLARSFGGDRYLEVHRQKAILRLGRNALAVECRPGDLGLSVFRVELAPVFGETNHENNHFDVAVNVVERDALVIVGAPSREYRFLAPLLMGDEGVRAACWLQSADRDYVQQGNISLDRLPRAAEEWAAFDVVILLDPDPARLTKVQATGLEAFVRAGGGLMVVGGRQFGLAALVKTHPEFEALLPVVIDPGRGADHDRIDTPFKVARSPAGRRHTLFNLWEDGETNDRRWEAVERTPFYVAQPVAAALSRPDETGRGTRTDGAKPNAVVLLERADHERAGATCLMALRRYGRGAVLYSGLDALWRWRAVADTDLHERFWRRVPRYLAALGSSDASSAILTTDREEYEAGNEVTVYLHVFDDALLRLLEDKRLQVAARDESGEEITWKLRPRAEGSQILVFTGRARRPGLLVFRAWVQDPASGAALFDVPLQVPLSIRVRPPRTRAWLTLPGRDLAEARLGPTDIAFRVVSDTDVKSVRFLYQVGDGAVQPLSEAVTGPLPQTGRDFAVRFTWPLDRLDVPQGSTIQYFVRVEVDRPTRPQSVESESAFIRHVTPAECQSDIFAQASESTQEVADAFIRQHQAWQYAEDGRADPGDMAWAAAMKDQNDAMADAIRARDTIHATITRADRNGLRRECMAGRLDIVAGLLGRVVEREHPAVHKMLADVPASGAEVSARRAAALKAVRVDQRMAVLILARALDAVKRWRDLQGVAAQVALLCQEQSDVGADTTRLAPQYLGKEVEDLSDEQVEVLLTLGKRQRMIFDSATALERGVAFKVEYGRRRPAEVAALKAVLRVLQDGRVTERTKDAWLHIEINQPFMISQTQEGVVKTLQAAGDDLVTAGQKIEEEPPIGPDAPMPDWARPEILWPRDPSFEAADTVIVGQHKTTSPEGEVLVQDIYTAINLCDAVQARVRYLAEHGADAPRFHKNKLAMILEHHRGAVAALDKAIADAAKENQTFCRDALVSIRQQSLRSRALIEADRLGALTQQMQSDALDQLWGLLDFLAMQRGADEFVAARGKTTARNAFLYPYALVGRDVVTVAAMGDDLSRAWFLQRRAVAAVSRFETCPAETDQERAIERGERALAADDQRQVAALLKSADGRCAGLSEDAQDRVRSAGAGALVALEADGYVRSIARGTPDKELGRHLRELADALDPIRVELILVLDARMTLPAGDVGDPASWPLAPDRSFIPESQRDHRPTHYGRDPAFMVMPYYWRRRGGEDLLTPRIGAMAGRALAYLVNRQDKDGGWSDAQYPSNTGITGLCCLALMAEGSRPRAGKYGEALDRGLAFLIKSARPDGAIVGEKHNTSGPMYEQCYATMALSQAYGDLPWQPDLRDIVARSVQLLQRCQKRDGGWRYTFSPEGDSDAIVTANVLWVLQAARKAGFTVNRETINKGVSFIEHCGLPEGGFRYRYNGRKMTPSMGGAGIIVLTGDASLNHPMIPPTRDRVDYDYRRSTIADLRERRYTVFNTFYAGLAMYTCGNDYWVPWYRKAAGLYAAMERQDGEVWDEHGNTVYPTAMAAIVLRAPLGYLPIFER